MNLLRWAYAIALACLPSLSNAQMQLPPVKDWAGRTVPGNGTALVDKNGVSIDPSNPMPVAIGGSVEMTSKRDLFQLATANAAAAPVTLYGGSYVFTQNCTAYGSVALRYRGPDGATMTTMLSKTAADSGGGTIASFGTGAIVDVALSGTTGCNATLARIPS